MIVPMIKYDLVLYRGGSEAFLENLRDLGLVDITTTAWEPGEADRALMASIELYRHAIKRLRQIASEPGFKPGRPFDTAEDTFMEYRRATSAIESLAAQAARARKEADEARVWGAFSPSVMDKLREQGVEVRPFVAYDRDFEMNSEAWGETHHLEKIASEGGMTYFVMLVPPAAEITIAAQEARLPQADSATREAEALEYDRQAAMQTAELARCAASVGLLEAKAAEEAEKLNFCRVEGSATLHVDGTLMVLEGWVPAEQAGSVDAFLDTQRDVVCIKSKPTPEDETPVLLRNGRFSSLFELIGGFYALPRYGTMDLTPYFAPFYMIFFGFCLGDGGYGLLLVLAGIILKSKKVTGVLGQVAGLTLWCGSATVVFGILTGSFFGIELAKHVPVFIRFRDYLLNPDRLFSLSLAVGMVQILFGMGLKVAGITIQTGFRHALSTIGWMVVIIATIGAMFLPDAGVAFSMDSPAYLATAGVGAFMMLFLNSPGKNPLVNLGAGLWNTYNDITGLVGDLLSYIRLFAIGLSGGILALVFNDLAMGLSPDIPVVKQVVMLAILLFGHGINIFMSCLSAFVHPLRLTFVEFYKNAGFESTQRVFSPFKRNSND